MRTVVLGRSRDPLLVLLLAAVGVAELGACGGKSESDEMSEALAGTGGGPSAGAPQAGAPVGMGAGPSHGYGGQDTGAGAAPPAVGLPRQEGVVPCYGGVAYPSEGSGFELCDNGMLHRPVATACPKETTTRSNSPFGGCLSDAECTDTENGRCGIGVCGTGECVVGCSTDGDCPSGEICQCDAVANHCVPASCKVDADCGDGLLCVSTRDALGTLGAFLCQHRDDECTTTCQGTTDGQGIYGTCAIVKREDEQSRECHYSNSTGGSCGRPFLIAGRETLAAPRSSAEWLDPRAVTLDVALLSPPLRRALADQWRDAALMEHASIAAFARFTLELLAFGAPPSLIAESTQAMADEQRHATTCFALASTYAGTPVAPGPLDVAGCLAELDLDSVVVTTFLEGCIGETIAALEARETARRVKDLALERVLSRIAEDESRHAALAWRFVHWALARSGGTLVARLRAELALAVAGAEPQPSQAALPVGDGVALEHGFVPAAFRASLRRSALLEIVAPCLDALAASTPGSASRLSAA